MVKLKRVFLLAFGISWILAQSSAFAEAPPKAPPSKAPVEKTAEASVVEVPKLNLGIGVLFHNLGKRVSNSETGAKSLLGTAYSVLSIYGRFGEGNWFFVPALHYTIPGRMDFDSAAERSLLALSVMGARKIKSFEVRLGPGILFYSIQGVGGTAILNNGNSISEFYKPAYISTSRLFYFDVGGGYAWRRFRVDLDTLITGTFGKRRAVSTVLSLSYGVF